MKLVSLNIWGGKITAPLLQFFQKNSDLDIFCLQEVFNDGQSSRQATKGWDMDIFKKISEALPNHTGYFNEEQKNEEGVAIFVNKRLAIKNRGWVLAHRWKSEVEANGGPLSRILQWVRVGVGDKEYTISHFHGLWHKTGKGDIPERIAQSKRVKIFIDSVIGPKIVCGDLNLYPDTKSLAILKKGLRELVTENNVQSTRSSLYPGEAKYADYMFVSKDVVVKEFRILPDVVSDHLPLLLEFN